MSIKGAGLGDAGGVREGSPSPFSYKNKNQTTKNHGYTG